jgi:hypothetical protein
LTESQMLYAPALAVLRVDFDLPGLLDFYLDLICGGSRISNISISLIPVPVRHR